MKVLIRAKEAYLNNLYNIDLLTDELTKRRLDTSLQFEAPYKKTNNKLKTASLYLVLGISGFLILFALLYEHLGNLYINLIFILLSFILVLLLWNYFESAKKHKDVKASWDKEFAIDEELTKKIKQEKMQAASNALNIIVISENYQEIRQINNEVEKAKYYQLLFQEYIDALEYINHNKITYEDYLAYYNEWEAKNTVE